MHSKRGGIQVFEGGLIVVEKVQASQKSLGRFYFASHRKKEALEGADLSAVGVEIGGSL